MRSAPPGGGGSLESGTGGVGWERVCISDTTNTSEQHLQAEVGVWSGIAGGQHVLDPKYEGGKTKKVGSVPGIC